MLGDIGRRAAIFAAQGQPLKQAHQHQNDRRCDADCRIGGQQADDEGRKPHQQHGDQEGVLATPKVAQAAEHDGAEGPHREAGGEGHQGEDIAGRLIDAREELHGDDRGERSVQIEVVPFDHGPDRRGQDHQLVVLADDPPIIARRTHGAVRHYVSLPALGLSDRSSHHKGAHRDRVAPPCGKREDDFGRY